MVYSISTAFAIYFVLWWVVLFAVLPFGVRSQAEDGEGPRALIPVRRRSRAWGASCYGPRWSRQ
jgi:predicted secreted protein